MAGNWKDMTKTLSGAYINIRSRGQLGVEFGGRTGILAVAFPLDFGKPIARVTMEDLASDRSLGEIGLSLRDADSDVLRFILQALKGTSTVLVYNTQTGGDKATGVVGGLNVTAKYEGLGGNNISVGVEAVDSGFRVTTYYNSISVDTQIVDNADALRDNAFVDFGAGESFETATAKALTGGANGTVSVTNFLASVAPHKPSVVAIEKITQEEIDKAKLEADSGNLLRVITMDTELSPDNRLISNFDTLNTVFYDDVGKDVTKDVFYFLAGQSAGAGRNRSLSYAEIPFIKSTNKLATEQELSEAIRKGHMVVHQKFSGAYVLERDINTLTTYDVENNYFFSDNRVMRTLIDIHDFVRITFENNYIGKIQNNESGRNLLKSDIVKFVNGLVAEGNIEGFDGANDVQVYKGNDLWSMKCDLAVKVTGTLEKLYMEILVSEQGAE